MSTRALITTTRTEISAPRQSIDQEVAAYWSLQNGTTGIQGSGAGPASAGYSLTNNNVVTFPASTFGGGYPNAALFVLASLQSLQIASISGTPFGAMYNTAFAITCWIKLNSLPGAGGDVMGIFSLTDLLSLQRVLSLRVDQPGNTLSLLFSSDGANLGTAGTVTRAGALSINTNYFVSGQRDAAGNISVNINNGTAATSTLSTAVFRGNPPLSIGWEPRPVQQRRLDGTIAGMRVCIGRTLIAGEEAYLYGSGTPPINPFL